MSETVLIVDTRKRCFLLSSDESHRDWELHGPFCERWPIYHAIHDPGSGTIYAAAASEWHGMSVWRSPDLGETWEQSSEGLSYGEESKLKLSTSAGPASATVSATPATGCGRTSTSTSTASAPGSRLRSTRARGST